ncbi:MAG: NAD-binding protein [Streptosporangiales bacterium]|nr:NAD-binding protein [Streptosporangiales bacterium]
MTDTVLGFIGLGVMGAPMCHNLLRHSGKPVTAYDIDTAAVAEVERAGGTHASSAAELVAASDIVFCSLPGGDEVEAVVTDVLGHCREGQTVVDLSTSPVRLVQRLAEVLAGRGVAFADAPVARTRHAAVEGTLAITVGADAEVFARVEPLLRCFATDVTHCGPVGAGALVKLLNNMVVFETVVALAEAVTLARRSGLVGDEQLFDALGKGSAASFTLENHGKKALLPDLHPESAFPARYMRKDVGYALDLAADVGVRAPAGELAHQLLDELCEQGHADAYHTAVVRLIDAE